MKITPKFCKNCLHFQKSSHNPYCGASKYPDLVTGNPFRTCFLERLDGIGRCGSMANNHKERKERKEKPKPVKVSKK